ncbi:uncharacterized protein BDR25DRAFT_303967 [Lindgomyces ingoldianus]|uniref:Uncharacterized protein n=1 Tax=Lindgomyces ingoldianus TaxID=673940 RepID=A0ACB6QUJ1_9PLEO|nr:uncharacterized protein BDR25DRAFT_303967 [Lindgomyces ingoldianus]KAF2470522.1 hypothetical protein BDR25DRAFT_303967 [Lindgomyces ingoldianus]
MSRAWSRLGLRRTNYFHPATSPSSVLRRPNSTKPATPNNDVATSKTIPGPSWLWLEPIYTPFRAYGRVQQRRPYATQFVSALVIYFIGDIVAQSISSDSPTAGSTGGCSVDNANGEENIGGVLANRDWARTGRALLIGGMAAIPGYRWFLWLGESFNYRSKILSLTTKVIVNQILFTPIFNSYFFGMQSLLTGSTLPEIWERIQHTVPVSWVNSCKIWPAVTAFSFTFIPIQFRSIFGGVIAIGWQTYLSLLNQRAAAEEQVAHEHAHDESKESNLSPIECQGESEAMA